tara:strand:+ start:1313 stop:1639 length:327 start_codon:yes stop_codon:yes gene_type:complete
MQNLHNFLASDDFVIVVRPVKESEEWTGEVQVSIVTNLEETTLNSFEYESMVALCNCAAASIPAMEENAFIRNVIETYASKHMLSPLTEDSIDMESMLMFDTDTKGSA